MQDTDMETGHLLVANSPKPGLLIDRQELLPIRRHVEFPQSRDFAIDLLCGSKRNRSSISVAACRAPALK